MKLKESLLAFLVVGFSVFLSLYLSQLWYLNQYSLSLTNSLFPIYSFYFAYLSFIFMLLLGLYWIFGILQSTENKYISVLSSALENVSSRRFFTLSIIGYSLLYGFLSGMLVFQPNVDFGKEYLFYSASFYYENCCGYIGSIPKIIAVLPQIHFALVISPINILLLPILSFLVSINISVAYYSFMVNGFLPKKGLSFILGSVTGLFTSCPSCAAFFLAGAIGGIGASSAALYLSSFQLLFLTISLPVLVASPLITSIIASKYASSCKC